MGRQLPRQDGSDDPNLATSFPIYLREFAWVVSGASHGMADDEFSLTEYGVVSIFLIRNFGLLLTPDARFRSNDEQYRLYTRISFSPKGSKC